MYAKVGGLIVAFVLVVVLTICCVSTEIVPAGYVAVQYNINGGIQDEILTQGWHMLSPSVHATLYSVGLEQSYLTADSRGDSKHDDSFSACSSEGKDIRVELTYTYQYEPDNVVSVFKRFKGQNGTEIRDNFIKPNIISWTKEVIAQYKVADILGSRRSEINTALTDYLSEKFAVYGITVSNVSLVNLEVDAETSQAINSKIAAQQYAETQAINNQTSIDMANANAEVMRLNAQAEAEALMINANAQAEANAIIQKSITPEILQREWVNKWNGVLPAYTSGGNDNVLFGINGAVPNN